MTLLNAAGRIALGSQRARAVYAGETMVWERIEPGEFIGYTADGFYAIANSPNAFIDLTVRRATRHGNTLIGVMWGTSPITGITDPRGNDWIAEGGSGGTTSYELHFFRCEPARPLAVGDVIRVNRSAPQPSTWGAFVAEFAGSGYELDPPTTKASTFATSDTLLGPVAYVPPRRLVIAAGGHSAAAVASRQISNQTPADLLIPPNPPAVGISIATTLVDEDETRIAATWTWDANRYSRLVTQTYRLGPQPPLTRYPLAVLADNPLVYYRLGAVTQHQLTRDLKGGPEASFNAPVASGPSLLPSGDGRSTVFTGAEHALTAQSFALVYPDPWSFECWVEFDNLSTTMWLLGSWGPSGARVYAANLLCSGPAATPSGANYRRLVAMRDNQWVATAIKRYSNSELQAGTTYHVVAVTDDGTRETHRLYLNGQEIPSTQGASVADYAALGRLAIGSGNNNAITAGHRLVGRMQEVAIYDHALTPQRIAAHYAAAQP